MAQNSHPHRLAGFRGDLPADYLLLGSIPEVLMAENNRHEWAASSSTGHSHPSSLAKFLGPVPPDFVLVSTLSQLYEDSPKITKRLTHTDVGTNSSLILPNDDVESQFLRSMDPAMAKQCSRTDGFRFTVLDVDDHSSDELVLKKNDSIGMYVLMGGWKSRFVDGKSLKAGDDVGVAFAKDFLMFKVVNRNN